MKRVVLEEGTALIDNEFGEDVTIVMDFRTAVLHCVFRKNVILEGTERVAKAKGTEAEWMGFPVFMQNVVHGNIEVKKTFKGVIRNNIVSPKTEGGD